MKRNRYIVVAIIVMPALVLFYPKKEILVPAMDLTVKSEASTPVVNVEVSRDWNHFLGPGWTASVTKPNAEGRVHFPEISRRFPIVGKAFYTVFSPIFEHQYPGFAGSVMARDPENYRIWQRLDFNDRNCCPTEITVTMHEAGDELDSTFTFGDIVPNQ